MAHYNHNNAILRYYFFSLQSEIIASYYVSHTGDLCKYANARKNVSLLVIGACVEIRSAHLPSFSLIGRPSGSTIQRCSSPFLIDSVGKLALSSFCSALIRASGFLVSSAAEASARYSRFRDTATASSFAAIGAKRR